MTRRLRLPSGNIPRVNHKVPNMVTGIFPIPFTDCESHDGSVGREEEPLHLFADDELTIVDSALDTISGDPVSLRKRYAMATEIGRGALADHWTRSHLLRGQASRFSRRQKNQTTDNSDW
jgi:hypothetical protein